jgi:cobalt-zinc-cadmium efflux system outer membrane protein
VASFCCNLIPIAILCLVFGCQKIQRSDDVFVSSALERRLDKIVTWNHKRDHASQIEENIQKLLQEELTVDVAVQIALFNNPNIQATFEEIGISTADLIEAGLFSNPFFDLFVRYPDKRKFVPDIEYSVTASFIDLFLIPLRVKVAKVELEQTTLRVTNDILDLAFDVEQTYYELQAFQQDLKYTLLIVELLSIQNEITLRQRNVYNINRLDFQLIQNHFLESKLEFARVQNEVIRLREKLNRLLGFFEEPQWTISTDPPPINCKGYPIGQLESTAFSERLDLQMARFEVLRLCQKLGIKQWWVYTNGRIGICGERDPDGLDTLGPAFSGEIPLFNYGQAARMRLQAELRQAQDRLASLEIQILSEVREAHKLIFNNLKIIEDYRNRIIPTQNQILVSSEELYNVMGLGIDRLLENKRQQILAFRHYILALRNYWMARVQLDRALGGKLYKISNCGDTK